MLADRASDEAIAPFMATKGCGLICLAMEGLHYAVFA